MMRFNYDDITEFTFTNEIADTTWNLITSADTKPVYIGQCSMPEVTLTTNSITPIKPEGMTDKILKNTENVMIDKIQVLKEDKVMVVTISRIPGGIHDRNACYVALAEDIKVITREPDVFDMRTGCFIALAKYFYSKYLTIEGIEAKAQELATYKWAVKTVDQAIKKYNRELVEQQKVEKEAEERKAARARRIAKKKKRDACKRAKERESNAIISALTELVRQYQASKPEDDGK